MRVLHVTPYCEHAWSYGGIPRVVAAQTRALSELGIEVTVATTDAWSRRGRLPRKLHGTNPPGVNLQVFPNLSNLAAYHLQLFMPIGLGRFLRGEAQRFDVAHLHGCHNLPGVIAARHLGRTGVPYVVQPNGTGPRIERRRLAKLVFDALLARGYLTRASCLIAVTDFERRQLAELAPNRPVTTIPNPVDLGELDDVPDGSAFRAQHQLGTLPLVLYLGQLSPRKCVDLAVRAVAALPQRDLSLVIAGSDMGEGRRLRRLAATLGIADRTRFVGVLQGEQRLAALSAADVVVYPTRDEIFGLVPLEALLCHSPVVVADDCGCGEVIGRTGGGLIVASGSVEAVASAIAQILDNRPAWHDAAVEGARRVRSLFAAPVVAAALCELYASLAVGSSR